MDVHASPSSIPLRLGPSEDQAARRWMTAMGAASLLALALPTAWITVHAPARPSGIPPATLGWWWLCFAIFAGAWLATAWGDWSRGGRLVLLVVQSLSALAANWLIPTVFQGVAIGGLLTMIVAASLAGLPPVAALAWIAGQSLGLLLIYFSAGWGPQISISAAGAYSAGQLAMLGIGRMAERQRRLREALAETVAELLSTRALLEEGARAAERTRIARELHDVLGHHLVAMRLQLEAAALESAASPEARRRIQEAASLARLLLADVRAAVSDLREAASIDLVGALRLLAESAPGPRIEVRAASDFDPGDAARAAAFLRCAQEAVTNARRHAGASRIEIELVDETLRVHDDGCGVGEAPAGSGLRGMAERVAALGGTIAVGPRSGGGTTIEATIPRRLAEAVPLRTGIATAPEPSIR